MTDEKAKKDPKANEIPPKESAKPKDQETTGNKQETETESLKVKSKKKKADDKKSKTEDKKKASLSQKEIDALILENADLQASCKKNQDEFLLIAAEFENFKKRISKDQIRSRELFKESMLGGLLPVLDDIDRALQHHEDDETSKVLTMTKTQLLAYLEAYEVKPFDSVGEEFDADKHDAMLTRAEEDKDDNIILEEFEKGYMIGSKVLRHAKVIVNIIE